MYHLTAQERYSDMTNPVSCSTLGEALVLAAEAWNVPDKFGNKRRVCLNGIPIFGRYFDEYEDYELYGIINDVEPIYTEEVPEYDKYDIIEMSYDN
jgi:hypothetical protein